MLKLPNFKVLTKKELIRRKKLVEKANYTNKLKTRYEVNRLKRKIKAERVAKVTVAWSKLSPMTRNYLLSSNTAMQIWESRV